MGYKAKLNIVAKDFELDFWHSWDEIKITKEGVTIFKDGVVFTFGVMSLIPLNEIKEIKITKEKDNENNL